MKLIDKIWEDGAKLALEEMLLYRTLKIDSASFDVLVCEYNELFRTNKCTKQVLQRYFGTKILVLKDIENGYILEK